MSGQTAASTDIDDIFAAADELISEYYLEESVNPGVHDYMPDTTMPQLAALSQQLVDALESNSAQPTIDLGGSQP